MLSLAALRRLSVPTRVTFVIALLPPLVAFVRGLFSEQALVANNTTGRRQLLPNCPPAYCA
eukprot:TRINITY_DN8226_c0_g1_i1.p2 TRINITY_DN8226_c0_g1~~TRINITY_DN8226_c0_g1_i1.p2  ORF type:complete len:61 (+),score=9.76 TRINITY_DN8226_c0_g1_i1:97-279(+)